MVYATEETTRRAIREICNVEVGDKSPKNGHSRGLETKAGSSEMPKNITHYKTGISAGRAPSVKGANMVY